MTKVIDVTTCGASPTNADDTAAIQQAINSAAPGDTVLIPAVGAAGPYMVDAVTGIQLKLNITLSIAGVVQAIPNNATHYAIARATIVLRRCAVGHRDSCEGFVAQAVALMHCDPMMIAALIWIVVLSLALITAMRNELHSFGSSPCCSPLAFQCGMPLPGSGGSTKHAAPLPIATTISSRWIKLPSSASWPPRSWPSFTQKRRSCATTIRNNLSAIGPTALNELPALCRQGTAAALWSASSERKQAEC